MAFIDGKEVLFSLETPLAQETGESSINAISQKAATDALGKKQDTLTNTTEFDCVPVVARNSSKVSYNTVSDGHGGKCIVRRRNDGNINLPPEANIPSEGDVAISVDKVLSLIGGISQATIYGADVAAGGSLASAIKSNEYGLYVVKGEDVKVTYTANDAAQTVTSDFHFFIKYLSTSNSNKILHIYTTTMLNGYVKSFDGFLSSDISVSNGSTSFGARVIKMAMKAIK